MFIERKDMRILKDTAFPLISAGPKISTTP